MLGAATRRHGGPGGWRAGRGRVLDTENWRTGVQTSRCSHRVKRLYTAHKEPPTPCSPLAAGQAIATPTGTLSPGGRLPACRGQASGRGQSRPRCGTAGGPYPNGSQLLAEGAEHTTCPTSAPRGGGGHCLLTRWRSRGVSCQWCFSQSSDGGAGTLGP